MLLKGAPDLASMIFLQNVYNEKTIGEHDDQDITQGIENFCPIFAGFLRFLGSKKENTEKEKL